MEKPFIEKGTVLVEKYYQKAPFIVQTDQDQKFPVALEIRIILGPPLDAMLQEVMTFPLKSRNL